MHFGAYLNNIEYINLGMEYTNKITRLARRKDAKNFKKFTFIQQPDRYGNIPMHIAVIESSYQVIQALLRFHDVSLHPYFVLRTQLTCKNKDGWIPLALAIISNKFKCFEIIAKSTADTLSGNRHDSNRIFFTNNSYFQGFTALTLAIAS